MFKFIKKLFGKKQEQAAEKKQISDFAEAEKLVKEKKQAAADRLGKGIGAAKSRIEHEKQELKGKIEQLRKAKLLNPNIPERAKHFADGNREAYIKKAEQFCEGVELPGKIDELRDFFNRFASSIVELAESAAKPYQILQEFFANETNNIRSAIGTIEKTVLALRETIKSENLAELEQLDREIGELNEKLERQDELSKELEGKQKLADELGNQKQKLGNELNEAEGDRSYLELKQKLIAAKENIKKIEQGILGSFSVLETALKKYAKVSFEHKEVAESYVKSPVAALSQDFELRIADCLAQIKKLLMKDELDVKERKKEKTIEEISKLSKDYLANLVKNYAAAKKDEQGALSAISSSETFKRIKELKSKISKLEQEFARANDELDYLKKKAGKLELEKAKQEIIEKANQLLIVNVN